MLYLTKMNINILTEAELLLLNTLIDRSGNIIICCHRSPDGDALGSSLGWAQYLIARGKNPQIVIPDAYPDFFQWLLNTEKIVRYDKHRETVGQAFAHADLVFCMDFNRAQRLDDTLGAVLTASPAQKVLIDHHPEPDIDTALCISHPEMSSTSELVFRIIWQSGAFETMTKACAIAIYCGMMTDTGGFTYNSNSPEIYFIISQLLTKHIDKDKIYRNVYHNYSEWRLRLMGYVMYQKLNVFTDLHASYFTLTRQDMARFRFIKGDAEGLVNLPLQIKGAKLSISLREDTERPCKIWLSLRSVDSFYCNAMAERYFNGGGHPNAAGGHLDCTIEEAETIVRKALNDFREELQR